MGREGGEERRKEREGEGGEKGGNVEKVGGGESGRENNTEETRRKVNDGKWSRQLPTGDVSETPATRFCGSTYV